MRPEANPHGGAHPAATAIRGRDDANRADAEWRLDQALAETFPASDPVSMTQPGGGPPTLNT